MSGLITIATRVLRKAGETLLRTGNRMGRIEHDSAQGAEKLQEIKDHIHQILVAEIGTAFPDHVVISSADDEQVYGDNGTPTWLIDGLCGEVNFARESSQYCVSLAVVIDNKTEIAALYNPRTDELISAVRGSGVRLNERRMRVGSNRMLKNSLVTWNSHSGAHSARCVQQLFAQGIVPRISGCVMLDLADVAAGRFDGGWFDELNSCYVRAGALIVQEAGGLSGDFCGGNHTVEKGQLVIGNPKIFKGLVQNLAPLVNER